MKEGMIFANRKSGKVCTIVEVNDKYKTVLVEFEDKSSRSYTQVNFRKSFKIVETQKEEVVMEEKTTETVSEVPKTEDNPVEPQKKEGRVKKPIGENIQKILDYMFSEVEQMGASVFVPKSEINFRSFKVDGKMFASVQYSGKSVRLNCRSVAVEGKYTPDKKQNHMFDEVYIFTELDKDKIDGLLQLSYAYQVNKKSRGKEN